MKKFIFIHGSASGETALLLDTESKQLQSEISKWYFEGRQNRVIGTSVPRPMFVELYKGNDGKRYCLYSFVLNECYSSAPDYREGQYFAVTIALQDCYCFRPSSIYSLLTGAYDYFIRNKIIDDYVVNNGKEYHNVYKISLFNEKEAVLIDFQKQISDHFDKGCQQLCKNLPNEINFPMPWNRKEMAKMVNGKAVCLPWNGETIHLEECDSGVSIDKLFKDGRIYISDKALRLSAVVEELREENDGLRKENVELQGKVNNPKPNPKDLKKIKDLENKVNNLNSKVSNANSLNEQLRQENNDLVNTVNGVSELLDKYNKSTNKQFDTINSKKHKEVSNSNGWKRWIKEILLIVILLLTLVCLVLNACFFRSGPSDFDKINSQIDSICLKVDALDNYVRN